MKVLPTGLKILSPDGRLLGANKETTPSTLPLVSLEKTNNTVASITTQKTHMKVALSPCEESSDNPDPKGETTQKVTESQKPCVSKPVFERKEKATWTQENAITLLEIYKDLKVKPRFRSNPKRVLWTEVS